MPEQRLNERPQNSLKYSALPMALWRSGMYFAPGYRDKRVANHSTAGLPAPGTSAGAIFSVLADEMVLAGFKIIRNPPTDQTWERFGYEVAHAEEQFDAAGWLADPRSYHQDPSVPDDIHSAAVARYATLGLPWQQLRWASKWQPWPDEPGAQRWLAYAENRRASAWILRHHDSQPRHWAVLVHGTEQGRLLVDQMVFRARKLHEELGCNVVLPLLPLHGSRRTRDGAGTGFPTVDPLDNVHGLAQSAFDVRTLLRWIETQSPASVSVSGLSLGGYVAALVAGLEPALGAVVGMVPAVDFPEVFHRQSPKEMRGQERFEAMAAASARVHEVVSPLRFIPATPPERLYVVAGLHDRLLDPRAQTARLVDHWGTSNVTWLARGHVTHMSSPELTAVLCDAISAAPLLTPR